MAVDGGSGKDARILQPVNFGMKSGVVYKDETGKHLSE
jgi:hypothetical protein